MSHLLTLCHRETSRAPTGALQTTKETSGSERRDFLDSQPDLSPSLGRRPRTTQYSGDARGHLEGSDLVSEPGLVLPQLGGDRAVEVCRESTVTPGPLASGLEKHKGCVTGVELALGTSVG